MRLKEEKQGIIFCVGITGYTVRLIENRIRIREVSSLWSRTCVTSRLAPMSPPGLAPVSHPGTQVCHTGRPLSPF